MATVPASMEQPPPCTLPSQGEEQPPPSVSLPQGVKPSPFRIYCPGCEPGLLDGMSEERRQWFKQVLRTQLTPHATYYFGEFRQSNYPWKMFLNKLVRLFNPDVPNVDKPVMFALSRAVARELVETHDVRTFATIFRATINNVCSLQETPVSEPREQVA